MMWMMFNVPYKSEVRSNSATTVGTEICRYSTVGTMCCKAYLIVSSNRFIRSELFARNSRFHLLLKFRKLSRKPVKLDSLYSFDE